MDNPEFDVAIAGAGPAGSALALLLARKAPDPRRIALLGKRFYNATFPATAAVDSTPDPRSLALNHGSRALLEQLGAWPQTAASIETVHVSQRGRLGRTLIRHEEMGVPRLGSVVAYPDLLTALHKAVATGGVTTIVTPYTRPLAAKLAHIDAGGRDIRSLLAVQADGHRPAGLRRDYGQHAVLATVHASQPKARWAYERFTKEGPLALLPHPQGADLYSVVWCCTPKRAEQLRRLDGPAFSAALTAMFGDRLGILSSVGIRHVFPLSLHAGPLLINACTIAIGNAAQTLHPVAGQGLNLGLRDAAQLAQTLAPWLCQPREDPRALLEEFARRRRPDRWVTAGITDFLPRIFSTHNPFVEHTSGASLLTLDLVAGLRAPLARHLLQGLRT
ncbi:MAG: monooxygenase [Burkholderiaceae bacterium]|nr:MAG: monooxygenase [Burkholderiaceae bacterium]TAM01644.1 MAG: monooxygenase [Pusillimonas sp.]